MNHSLFYSSLMLLAGLGIPVMAALNGGLGVRLQNPSLAAVILFTVGLLIAVSYLLLTQGVPTRPVVSKIPFYWYLGGVFVVLYISSITWVAPRFGLGNAVSFVLLGQLIAMTLIDHFGLIGAPQFTLSIQRAVGLVFMVIGVFLVVQRAAV